MKLGKSQRKKTRAEKEKEGGGVKGMRGEGKVGTARREREEGRGGRSDWSTRNHEKEEEMEEEKDFDRRNNVSLSSFTSSLPLISLFDTPLSCICQSSLKMAVKIFNCIVLYAKNVFILS